MEPATCGSTTLAMVLNSLSLDPKKRWKGLIFIIHFVQTERKRCVLFFVIKRIWRWYSEETLEGMKSEYIE